MSESFRDRVIAATGLSIVFAASVVDRACKRASIDPQQLDAAGLEAAMPSIEKALDLYLPPEEIAERRAAVRALARIRAA